MLLWEAQSDGFDEDKLRLGLSFGQNHSKLGFESKGTDQFVKKQDPCLHLHDLRLFISLSVCRFFFVVTEGEGILRARKKSLTLQLFL